MRIGEAMLDRARELAREALGAAAVGPVETHKRQKSAVFRVAGPDGASVIVKGCPLATARVEAAVYCCVLAPLPVTHPVLHRYRELDGVGWLVVDDAGGRPYDPSNAHDRATAGRWLAELHVGAAPLARSVRLPERGAGYYRDVLASATRTLEAARRHPAWPAHARADLEGLIGGVRTLDAHWSEVEDVLGAFPRTLVHGGFAGKNVHVRPQGSTSDLLPFDWEAAGWGVPAADLSAVDLRAYFDHAGAAFRARVARPARLSAVGTALWNIAPIPGEAATVASGSLDHLQHKFAFYRARLAGALAALGWARPVPP